MAVDDSPMTDSSTSSDDEPIETLVEGRARRSTAGKNMGALLDAEADDELALLFAEDEDDEEFESGEEEGAAGEGEEVEGAEYEADEMLDSSSDDEDDRGPDEPGDELEGEKELERQVKAERLARKRKEHDSMMKFPALRKRVKIGPTATAESITGPTTPTPRPKKKSERISWLPTPEDGPTRSSSRRQTMQNKELTHARLKDSEEKRVRLIATMEAAARRKQKLKPKVMTQEERLAEAAKTERLNSKSLNRWEEMERKRSEEQKAKLAALQNRRLEGAVTTWWSGLAKWINGRLAQVGAKEVKQAPEIERKRKGGRDRDESPKRAKSKKTERVEEKGGEKAIPPGHDKGPDNQAGKTAVEEQTQETKKDAQPQQVVFGPPPAPGSFLDGIHIYASMKDDVPQAPSSMPAQPAPTLASTPSAPQEPTASISNTAPEHPSQAKPSQAAPVEETGTSSKATPDSAELMPKGSESILQPAKTEHQESQKQFPRIKVQITRSEGSPATDQASPSVSQQPQDKKPESPAVAIHVDENSKNPQDQQTQIQAKSTSPPTQPPPTQPSATQPPLTQKQEPPAEEPQPSIPTPPPTVEHSSRNLIILENFESKTPQEREEFNIFFNSRKPQKLQKIPLELCPITSRPARYRDPETKLPYANAVAYREIRQTLANRYAWSGLLGCFVGPIGVGARGVPERFLAPNAPPPPTAVLVGDAGGGSGTSGSGGSVASLGSDCAGGSRSGSGVEGA
ncbi:vacuolar protein sorting-associated protein 72 [Blastomyces parvus]|uniref:Vacuolar protein sorting-associated protein 72 n=1 Tax=Blastomyces parvus TaxID=2060905 RepID=A0A2B7WIB6_9EURO|nr:vacuolar protein sorting-associated protein 72 [Blastomyces parvus]